MHLYPGSRSVNGQRLHWMPAVGWCIYIHANNIQTSLKFEGHVWMFSCWKIEKYLLKVAGRRFLVRTGSSWFRRMISWTNRCLQTTAWSGWTAWPTNSEKDLGIIYSPSHCSEPARRSSAKHKGWISEEYPGHSQLKVNRNWGYEAQIY